MLTTLDLSTLWWLLAAAVLIVEMLTGTVYLLLIAAAFVAAALAAYGGAAPTPQILIAAIIGSALVLAWWRVRKTRRGTALAPEADPELNLDIGQTVTVEAWEADGTAHVMHRGARWTAMQQQAAGASDATGVTGVTSVPGLYRIVALDGSRLVVAPLA